MKTPSKIESCRISGKKDLITVLDLGTQALTGVFPKTIDTPVTAGPLELAWSPSSGLVQLRHSYDLGEMYGMNYGYRSGLNGSMVAHLTRKVRQIERQFPVQAGDLVIDIGSNDATTLKAYATGGIRRLGVDPTGVKFKDFYTDGIELVPDFFSFANIESTVRGGRAKIITSIAMFYDLESPRKFVADIRRSLHNDGVWHFEQSYLPTMLRMNSYDTVCHEHLEYYSLHVVKNLLESEGLKVIDVQLNAVNGGSFAVTAAIAESTLKPNAPVIDWLLGQEDRLSLDSPRPYRRFEERVFQHRRDLVDLIRRLNSDGRKVAAYGASTKGNVLLQFCGFTSADILGVAEVNPDKFGCVTPGTHIPIASEAEIKAAQPDYMLVLPWHFRESIVAREQVYLANGGKLIFPLPEIEIM